MYDLNIGQQPLLNAWQRSKANRAGIHLSMMGLPITFDNLVAHCEVPAGISPERFYAMVKHLEGHLE